MPNFTTGTFETDIWISKDGHMVTSGKTVLSKYLVDKNGSFVINPLTDKPYIIPANMDFDTKINNFDNLTGSINLYNFKTGAEYDLQRVDVDGKRIQVNIDGNKVDGFIPDYTASASLYFGAAVAATGNLRNIGEFGGGILNAINAISNSNINTDGKYWNNPNNVINIKEGYNYYQENLSTNSLSEDVNNLIDSAIDFGNKLLQINTYITDKSLQLTLSQRQELAQIISAGGNPNDFLRAVYENQQINIEIIGDNLEGFSSQAQADTTRNYYKSLKIDDGIENSDGSITWISNGKAVAVEIKDEKGNIILIDTDGNKVIIDDKGISTIHNEETITFRDEHGNLTQVTYEENSDLLIYGDPANPDKITFTDENGDYQVWQKDKDGNFVQTNKIDYSQVSNTAINQIGSLIIANNQNFSNIEKIAVSSSVATIADFTSYAQSGKAFNLEDSALNNLQGAVVSFAVSAYFAKNDNISDILGMDGTFVGGIADFALAFTTAYVGTN